MELSKIFATGAELLGQPIPASNSYIIKSFNKPTFIFGM
jgi:hypothetical protein